MSDSSPSLIATSYALSGSVQQLSLISQTQHQQVLRMRQVGTLGQGSWSLQLELQEIRLQDLLQQALQEGEVTYYAPDGMFMRVRALQQGWRVAMFREDGRCISTKVLESD